MPLFETDHWQSRPVGDPFQYMQIDFPDATRSNCGEPQPATLWAVLRLRDKKTYTFQRQMRLVFKAGVSILSLLLLATPIMACLIPAASMTAAERDCCKRMAGECGKAGMPQSHPCCQTTTVPAHFAAIKSSSDVNSVQLAVAFTYALPHTFTTPTLQEPDSVPWAADIHSPPVSPPSSISVLRI